MSVQAPIALCFIMYSAVFIVMALLIPCIKLRYQLLSSVLGLISVLPITCIEYVVFGLSQRAADTSSLYMIAIMFLCGLIEETAKLSSMLLLPYKKLELAPFFAVSILCGLTLGSFESIIYFFGRMQKIGTDADTLMNLIIIRMFSATLIHTFCAGLSGLCLWTRRHKFSIIPFILAVLLHGLYDFFVMLSSNGRFFSIAVILLAASECRSWYKSISSALKDTLI